MAADLSKGGTRKTVSVVFSDLTGSTSLGERLDQEVLRQVMSRYFEEMNDALVRHGGTVEKYIGDAVMAVFGLQVAHEEDALRAVRAASDMRSALGTLNEELEARWGVRLQARTGVNTGEVVTQAGSGLQTFLAADCVNVAARLEQAAPPGEILVGEPTYRHVRNSVVVEAVEPLSLKGKAEPVAAYRLKEVLSTAAVLTEKLGAALVGRQAELAEMEHMFEQAVATKCCQLLTISGEAGLGKSRLARELASRLGERATYLYGRCLSYGESLTFWPLAEAVKVAAGIVHEESSDQAIEKVARLAGEEAEDTVGYVVSAMSLDSNPVGIQEAFWAMRKLFETMADRRPLVLAFDNVQWAEPAFLDFIDYLYRSCRTHPLLVLCLTRPELSEEVPDWGEPAPNRAALDLKPLGDGESRLLVEGLLGTGVVNERDAGRIGATAGGNPFFLTELVEMLVDDQHLKLHDGHWTAVGDLSSVSLPPTISALVHARLDSLEPVERRLLEHAAVIGHRFSLEALLMLQPADSPTVHDDALTALERKGFIRPLDRPEHLGLEGFRFEHNLVRDGTYQAMLKETRADLHQRLARWIEQRAGERVGEYQEIVGYHLEQAYKYRESLTALGDEERQLGRDASKWLGAAGRRALSRGDTRAAVKLLERAIALLPGKDPGRADLLLRLSIAFAEMGETAEADAVVSQRIAAEHRGRPFMAYRDEQGRQQVFDFERAEGQVSLGRRSENDISLRWDGEVSRVHALLEREGDAWFILDEGLSRNGTFVNGDRVTARRRLLDGDVVRLGDTILLYREPAKSGFHALPGHSHASTLADGVMIEAPELTETETLVLGALCRSWASPVETGAGSAEERLARELKMRVHDVRRNLAVLFAKLEVDAASDEERLAQLVARSLGLRLVASA